MGNRAVITAFNDKFENNYDKNGIGIYLHWNGGRDSIEGFLTYCKLKGYRSPTDDNYGWARLTQVIANFFGGTLSVGVDICDNLDCTNGDNGVYLIKDWIIVERGFYHNGYEQTEYNLKEFVEEINKLQPTSEQLTQEQIDNYFKKKE